MLHRRASAILHRLSAALVNHPYSAIGLMLSAATVVGLLTLDLLQAANVEALFLLVVLISALKGGRRAAIIVALASAIIFDFCFIPPRFSFEQSDLAYLVTLCVFVVVAVTTSELTSRAFKEHVAWARAEADSQAKDALLNRIAHELRTPLTTILGWVQILQATAGDTQRTARGLAGLQRNAQLLARLVGDLLDVSRIHVGKLGVRLQPTALARVVSRAVEDAAIAAAEKGVTLESYIDDVDGVLADECRIEQVVTNLVSNAVKFTPAHGRITVTLSAADGYARLVVADTGEGITAEFIPHVFEPFSQGRAENSAQGLGLGLAIVKQIVDAHHGQITVESAGPGCGTTFLMDLPLVDSPALAPDLKQPTVRMMSQTDHIVLQ